MIRTTTLLLALSVPTIAVHAQNTCLTAQVITAGTHTVPVIDGNECPWPICSGGSYASLSEWYAYTPTEDHGVTVTTDLPANAGRDTRLQVYAGGCGALQCVAGDDDSGSGNLSTATFNVQSGITYRIAFDNRWETLGFQFTLTEGEPID